MPAWLSALVGGLGALIIAAIVLLVAGRKLLDLASDAFVRRMMTDKYVENLWEFIATMGRTGSSIILENQLRSQFGTIPNRPFGAVARMTNFRRISFNPAQLVRMPTPDGVRIATSVVLGKRAARPMVLAIPIIVSSMAYGLALTKEAKVALARGAALAGTASGSGEGGLLPEERQAAKHFILQYSRGGWTRDPKILQQADMIEIQAGQGAIAGVAHTIKARDLGPGPWKVMGLPPGSDAVVHAHIPGVASPEDLRNLVTKLRQIGRGVPISLKFAAADTLEADMAIAAWAGVDVITLDGGEAGTAGAAPILEDDFGLGTFHAVTRGARFLEAQGLRDRISLVVAGGLATPGDFLKALALGADAVAIGTQAMFAISHKQILKALPWEPPTELTWYTGKMKQRFDPEAGARHLASYLQAVTAEMVMACRALGKRSLAEVNRDDLFTLDKDVAEAAGIRLGTREPVPGPPAVDGRPPAGTGGTAGSLDRIASLYALEKDLLHSSLTLLTTCRRSPARRP